MSTNANEDAAEQDVVSHAANKLFGNVTPPITVEFGGGTHPGLVRDNNEDHYAVIRRYRSREVLLTNMPPDAYPPQLENVYAFAVADGVGGAVFGEVASEMALRTGWELTGRAFNWGFGLSDRDAAELLESVNVFIQLIHRRIKAEAVQAFKGMGTTLTGALTVGWDAFIAHVGDSRAYLHRQGKLFRLTHDQTLAELMVKTGMISSVDQAAERFRSTLISCLGGNYLEVEVETSHVSLEEGDELLLCSDGLTDMVEEPAISSIMDANKSPQQICDELIQAALDGGGRDNVTVVVARYSAPTELDISA